MPKKSKKSGKKNVAKRTAASAQHHKQAESAMSAVAPDRLRAVASRWGTIVSLLIIAVLAGLYWSTNPENCHSLSRYEPMWTFLSKYGIVQRPTEATMAHVCSRVHSATHACLFLSGGTDSATNKVHNGFTSAWNWAGHFFGKTSASDVTYAPSVLYKRDPRDVLFAVTWGVALLALRGVLMSTLLLPVARRLVKRPPPEKWVQAGHQRKYYRSIDRFAEQFWICILYATSLALVVPFWFWNPEQLWVGYPHTTMDGLTKAVYLWEASNYIHQLFVINIEARRSDYLQMTVHHIVTMLLIGGSYACCFWRIGLVILLLMDPSDVLLALAKMLKYMGWQTTCDAMFGAFMISWTITRHICYMFVMMTCIYDAPRLIPYRSPVDLRAGYAFTPALYVMFISLLAVLQSILLVWFGMILKVTYRVLTNAGAIDSRSDDDSD